MSRVTSGKQRYARLKSIYDSLRSRYSLSQNHNRLIHGVANGEAFDLILAVGRAAERFLQSTAWEDSMVEILGSLCKAARTSRAIYLEITTSQLGDPLAVLRYMWSAPGEVECAEDDEDLIIDLQDPSYSRWKQILSNNEVVSGVTSTFTGSERLLLEKLSVRSILLVPVMVGQRWGGLLGLTECHSDREWTQQEASSLKIAASVFGAAILRRQTEALIKNLYTAEREQRQFAQALQFVGEQMSASLDLDEILDLLLEEVARIVPYDTATILMVKENEAVMARWQGFERLGADNSTLLANIRFQIDRFPTLRQMQTSGRPIIIPDTTLDPDWVWTDAGRHIRSFVSAPILSKGKVIAFVSLDKMEPGFYQTIHAEQLAAFCGQAGLAMQNALLFKETSEMLAREQGLNELVRIISTFFDLPRAIQETLRLTAKLVCADSAVLALIGGNGDELYYTYQQNIPNHLSDRPVPRSAGGIAWKSIETGQPFLVEHYKDHPEAHEEWVQAGLESLISVPVSAGETPLGVMGMFSMQAGQVFTARDLAFLESIGRQIGIAIQNVRLFDAVRRRAHEAETLRQISSAMTSALDLENVLERIMLNIEKVVPYDSAAVFLVEGDKLRMMAAQGFPVTDKLIGQTFPVNNDLVEETFRTGRAITLKDANADARFERWGDVIHVRGWVCAPLIAAGKPIGLMTLDSMQVGAYDQSDALLVQAFANEAASAIEKARLFNQVQEMAVRDPLTVLYNRRYFFDTAQKELDRANLSATPVSMIMIDIDHFKSFNDLYGHMTGDRVLVLMAKVMLENVREEDIVSRYGGEEFLILLPGTAISMAVLAAERIRVALAGITIDVNDEKVGISVSIGATDNRIACQTLEELFERVDQALYVTKRTGRGRITVWTPEIKNIS